MAKKSGCPQCGAKNDPSARRCRVCANLLNATAPEVEYQPKGLPDHIQRRVDAVVGDGLDTHIPGVTDGGGFGSLPPPPGVTRGDATGGQDPYGPPAGPFPPAPAYAPDPSAPPPPAYAQDPPAPTWEVGPPGDEIVIEAPPRHPDPIDPYPVTADESFERFDPNALFADMGRDPLPPPPPPPDELRLPPPPQAGPDPLWSVEVRPGATSAEIEEAAKQALREERLRKRPGFLDKVFKPEDDADS